MPIPTHPPLRRRLQLALGTLALTLLVLLFAELLVRDFHVPGPEERAETDSLRLTLRHGQPCATVERVDGEERLVTLPAQDDDPVMPTMPLARTPGVRRIAIVGESSAWLMGRAVRALLDGSGCAPEIELLACGAPAASSHLVERRFDEVMGYAPDAVVVLFGHNLHYVFATRPAYELRLRELRSHSALLSWAASLFPASPVLPHAMPREPPPTDDEWASATSGPLARPGLRPPVDRFIDDEQRTALDELRTRRMLERVVAKAREKGVGLVLSTMASNRLFPPAVELADRRLPAFLDATMQYDSGQRPEAIAALSSLVQADERPLYRFTLGEWLREEGRHDEAARQYARAVVLSPMVARAPDTLNGFIRALSTRSDAVLLDTVRRLEQAAPDAIPGWESFADNCHLADAALATEAVEVVRLGLGDTTVRPTCRLEPKLPEGPPPIGDFLDNIANRLANEPPVDKHIPWDLTLVVGAARFVQTDGPRSEEEAKRFLFSENEGGLLEPSLRDTLAAGLAEGLWRQGRRDAALALLEQVRRPESPSAVHVLRARFLVALGRTEEARTTLDAAGDDPIAQHLKRALVP